MSQKHKGRRLSKLATFRSRLLQFVLLLTHRYHPSQTWTNEDSLQTLREKIESNSDSWHTRNGRNAAAIRCSFDFDPMDDDARLHARRARAIELDMPQDTQQWLTNPKGRPTLYTLLPSFMELTAARTSLFDEWTPGSDWFDLAGQYMLQAVIEEYVHYGEHREEVFNATFAFGTTSAQLAAEDERVVAVQSLFRKEGTNEQRPEWTSARQKYIDEVSYLVRKHQIAFRVAIDDCIVTLFRRRLYIRSSSGATPIRCLRDTTDVVSGVLAQRPDKARSCSSCRGPDQH
jgi:hypothetical protein